MIDFLLFLILFIITALLSYIGTKLLIGWLSHHNIMAIPNNRSCHKVNTPVGGGWILFGLTAITMTVLYFPFRDPIEGIVLSAMMILAGISWLDDKNFVSPKVRMALQIIAVLLVLSFLPSDAVVFAHILPVWLDRLLTAFLWLWFINLYNFMDGIDGIAGVETVFISLGLLLTGAVIGLPFPYLVTCCVIAGAATGFLGWNWHPAKIFMGDIGSITMGFLLGWLLIQTALKGHLIIALILPLYFLVDATYTLLRRMYQGENFTQPHKTHFYQQASIALKSHSAVVKKIAAANLILIIAALWALSFPLGGIFLATVTVSTLIAYFVMKSDEAEK